MTFCEAIKSEWHNLQEIGSQILNGSQFSFEYLKLLEKKSKDRQVKKAVRQLIDYLNEKCNKYISDYRYIEYFLSSGVDPNFFLDGIRRSLEDKMENDIIKKQKYCQRVEKFKKLVAVYLPKLESQKKIFEKQILGQELKPFRYVFRLFFAC